jgi:hypothetical protein
MNREKLMRLQERLVRERERILAEEAAVASERLPHELIHELAEIDAATHAVTAELARHTPRLGYGSEA